MGNIQIILKRMISSLRRYLGKHSLWTLLVPTVLVLIHSSVAFGLGDVIPQLNFWLLFSISITSMFSTWILAQTKLRWLSATSISLLLAIPFVLIRAGRLESQLMKMLQVFTDSINLTLFQGTRDIENFLSTWTSIGTPLQDLLTNIGTLFARSEDWIMAVLLGKPIFDPVVTVMIWGLIMWTVSFWSAWLVRRNHKPLLGLLPAGSLLTITLSYSFADTAALLAMVGMTLLFIGVTQQSSLEKIWQRKDVYPHHEIRRTVLATVVFLSLFLVILAAFTPTITLEDMIELGQQWTSGQNEDTEVYAESLGLSSKPRRERTAIDNVRVIGLPQKHLLGSGPELSEKVVMQVHMLEGSFDGTPPTYYWRSITYDQYSGDGWLTSGTNTELYTAGQLVTTIKESFQQSLNQEFKIMGQVGRLLFFAGSLVSVDQDFLLSHRSNQDIFGASIDTSSYQVDTLIPMFNENELRETGTEYPDWIKRRYLALPDDLPQRVRDLAQQLTATVETPYDRAFVIESYLRAFPYSLDVPPTSRHRDVADYFLFDLQRGHCGYYATSMSVLARAAGLPARLVLGYASNRFDPATQSYVVTQADAHAWVEIYFQEYGWVEFEPTPNHPPIPRLMGPTSEDTSIQEELIPAPGFLNFSKIPINLTLKKLLSGTLNLFGILLLTIVMGIIFWLGIDNLRIRLMHYERGIELLYKRLKSFASQLEIPCQPGDTPYEFITTFTQHIDRHYYQGPPRTDLARPMDDIIKLYVQANYTPHSLDPAESKRVIRAWGGIHLQLIRLWVVHKARKLLRRRKRSVSHS